MTPGDRIGPYEVVGLVGSGGMGEVYRARDPKLNREVAIKILPDALAADPTALADDRKHENGFRSPAARE
jgi:serine/threonine-protein kinase